jgi:hypothetical protein
VEWKGVLMCLDIVVLMYVVFNSLQGLKLLILEAP